MVLESWKLFFHHLKFKHIIINRHHVEYLDRYCLVGRQGLLWVSCGTLHFLGCCHQGPDHSFIWAISQRCLYSEFLGETREHHQVQEQNCFLLVYKSSVPCSCYTNPQCVSQSIQAHRVTAQDRGLSQDYRDKYATCMLVVS